jgi:histidyl-tRNA synthetase
LGLGDRSAAVLRAIDKLEKLGVEKVTRELADADVTTDQTRAILEFADCQGTNEEVLERLSGLVAGNPLGETGFNELRTLFEAYCELGIRAERVRIDPSIARGLDYYTGTIFETFLADLPGIGSVCSGGRYNDLAGMFTKELLPGIGASLGLDRLLAAMEQLGKLPKSSTPAQVMIANFSDEHLTSYLSLARDLRRAGFAVDFYPEPKKLGVQFKHADRRGIPAVIVAGPDEIAAGTVQIKWLHSGEQVTVSAESVGETLRAELMKNCNQESAS